MFICCLSIATTETTALIGLLAVILLFAFADLIAICRNMCLNKREASEDAPLTLFWQASNYYKGNRCSTHRRTQWHRRHFAVHGEHHLVSRHSRHNCKLTGKAVNLF